MMFLHQASSVRCFFPGGVCQRVSGCSCAGLTPDFLWESAIPWLSVKSLLLRVWKLTSGKATSDNYNPCTIAQMRCSKANCQPPILPHPRPAQPFGTKSELQQSSSHIFISFWLPHSFTWTLSFYYTCSLSFFGGQLLLFFTASKVWLNHGVWKLKMALK